MKKICPACKRELPWTAFYRRRQGTQPNVYCKPCTTRQVLQRQHALKRKACDYKGGKCARCGYDRYVGALEFHHLDPGEKDFSLSRSKLTSFDKVKAELDKCVLLCANCHREEHARLRGRF